MQEKVLCPEQLLATSQLTPEDMLPFKIYYRVFQRGYGDCLPPIIVAKIKDSQYWIDQLELKYEEWVSTKSEIVEWRRQDYRMFFSNLTDTPYFILDGNHRALAATLTHQPINALELQSDEDIQRIKTMLKNGELFFFPHNVKTVLELEGLFIEHSLSLTAIPPHHSLIANTGYQLKRMRSVRKRADLLCHNKLLPSYVVELYLHKRSVESTINDSPGDEEYSLNVDKQNIYLSFRE